jgi:maltose O-acetyltransferase
VWHAAAMAADEMKNRMLRGEDYLADDPVLTAERLRAQLLLERFNATSAADPDARAGLLHELFGRVGEGSVVLPPLRCDYGYNVSLGARSFVNYGAILLDVNPIEIGDDVQIATGVQLLTATHPLDAPTRLALWESGRPISIGDAAWLGAGAIVLPGVRIGREAVVGAGAIVTRDVAPGTVVAGNPARLIRDLGLTGQEARDV